MKRKISFIFAALLLTLTACGKSKDTSVYGSTVAGLGDDQLFATVETDAKAPILLVADQVYGDGQGNQAAISCDVYYSWDGQVENLGNIKSYGTAYPIAYDKSGLYTGSGHEVQHYEINDKEGTLVLAEGVYEDFDENGNASYTRITDGNTEETATEEDFLALVSDYGKATVVNFGYGATGR